MARYIAQRMLYAVVTIFVLVTLTFFMMRLLPGDPFIGPKAITPETMEALNAKYGLDKPLHEQYFTYVGNLLHGDLGISIKTNRPITRILAESFPYSAELGVRSLALSLVFGIALGTLAAIKRGRALDTGAMFVALVGVSVPSFIIGPILQYFLALKFRQWWGIEFFPVFGWDTEAAKIIPAIALSLGTLATLARLMRTSMLDVLGQDYIKTAKAKGLGYGGIIRRHAMRNSILPVVTVLGPVTASLLTGTFVVENIFAIPGMGKHFVQSTMENDYTLIAGTTLFYGVFLVIATLIVDILYGFIDPRIKLAKVKE